jgi:hypothetical protein
VGPVRYGATLSHWLWADDYDDNHPSVVFSDREGKDSWIERYLLYLSTEHVRLRGGGISSHYLHCATVLYARFRASRLGHDRCRAWRAIATVASWLAQLEGGPA